MFKMSVFLSQSPKNNDRPNIWSFFCILGLVSILSLIILNYGTVPAAPSDPLRYISPAINPNEPWVYWDRIILWYHIRLIYFLWADPLVVGSLTSLSQLIITFILSLWWTRKRYGRLGMGLLWSLLIVSPAWIGPATYTYPTMGMTMWLVLALFIADLTNSESRKFFFLGLFTVPIVLSKIQGVFFLLYIAIQLLTSTNRLPKLGAAVIGMFSSAVALLSLLVIDPRIEIPESLLYYLTSPELAHQIKGRAQGGFPMFHIFLLEPSYFISVVGIISLFFSTKAERWHPFAKVGLIQILGLFLIYLITARGGPPIANYILDFHHLGLICFCCFITSLFAKFSSSYLRISNVNYISLLIIPLIILVIHAEVQLTEPTLYLGNLRNEIVNIIIMAMIGLIFISSVLFFIYSIVYRPNTWRKIGKASGFLCVACLIVSSHKGMYELIFRRAYNLEVHQIVKTILQHPDSNILIASKTYSGGERLRKKVIRTGRKIYDQRFDASNATFKVDPATLEGYDLLIKNRSGTTEKSGVDRFVLLKLGTSDNE